MKKFTGLCIFVCSTLLGCVGGYLGSGFGMMAEVMISGVGSVVGVYVGWKLAQRIGD